ncbi:DUF4345 domain-containing protein [Streptomyces vinaceus]|uniref:DUF4345 domain-containing protein n=1 Tax=Streptomyces vinaceus TaxID=1960 RepID=UPI00380A3357
MVQLCFALFAVIAVLGGTRQLLVGRPGLDPVSDSVYRFMAGIYLGMGLICGYLAWQAVHHGTLVYLVAGTVFLGGLGRLVSIRSVGVPEPRRMFVTFTGAELLLPLVAAGANAAGAVAL